jgi:hypothetical protein
MSNEIFQMIDFANVPSTTEQALKATSEVAAATKQPCGLVIYTGGAGFDKEGTLWSLENVSYLKQRVPVFPINVPIEDFNDYTRASNDVYKAIAALSDFGLANAPVLTLDMEAGATAAAGENALKYINWYVGTAPDYRKAPYGSPSFFCEIAQSALVTPKPDAAWIASAFFTAPHTLNPYGIPNFPNEYWNEPGQRAWQYGSGVVNGISVDFNVFDSSLVIP